MPITKDSNRQATLTAMVDVNFADIASGVNQLAVQLPGGAIVTGGAVTVITAFNSVTSDVLDVGDSALPNRYLNDANLKVVGRTPLIPTGFITTAIGDVVVLWVGVGGGATVGKARLEVEYIVVNRAFTSQG